MAPLCILGLLQAPLKLTQQSPRANAPPKETQQEGGLPPRLWVTLRQWGPPISSLCCLGAAFIGGAPLGAWD